MRRFLVVAALCLAASASAACADGKGAAIAGAWTFDAERAVLDIAPALRKDPRSAAFPPEVLESKIREAQEKVREMRVEYVFGADGKFTLTAAMPGQKEDHIAGTWEFKDGKYLVTEREKNGKALPGTDPHDTIAMELKDGDLFFPPPDMPFLVHLRRR